MSSEKFQKKIYLPGLHGLRAIATVLVIITHVELFKAKWGLPNLYKYKLIQEFGTIGVDFFFVLSGFLITYLLFKEKEKYNKVSIKNFYIRRVLRIWPLYYIVLILVFFILPFIGYPEVPGLNIHDDFYERLTLFTFFLPNVSKAFYDFVPYGGIMWSVGVEEQFYLIWPLILAFSNKYFKNIVSVFVFLILIKALTILPVFDNFDHTIGIRKFLAMLRLEIMAIGGIGAWLLYFKKKSVHAYLLNDFIQIISYTSIFVIIYFLPSSLNEAKHIFLGFLFIIIILNVSSNNRSFIKLENKYFRFLGNISYGMYMYHMIIANGFIYLGITLGFDSFSFNISVYTFTLFFTILVSHYSYVVLEKRFLKLKSKFSVIHSGLKVK